VFGIYGDWIVLRTLTPNLRCLATLLPAAPGRVNRPDPAEDALAGSSQLGASAETRQDV